MEYSDFWDRFKAFLRSEFCSSYTKNVYRYAKQFHLRLVNGNLSQLKTLSNNKRLHAMKALSALAKFTGVYDDFRRLLKAYARA